MTRKFAALLTLVFVFSIGQSAFGQNSNSSTTMKSGRSAERREERGEERTERRKHRRHRRGHRRHSGNTTGNANR
jgi:hypothetical protein